MTNHLTIIAHSLFQVKSKLMVFIQLVIANVKSSDIYEMTNTSNESSKSAVYNIDNFIEQVHVIWPPIKYLFINRFFQLSTVKSDICNKIFMY